MVINEVPEDRILIALQINTWNEERKAKKRKRIVIKELDLILFNLRCEACALAAPVMACQFQANYVFVHTVEWHFRLRAAFYH